MSRKPLPGSKKTNTAQVLHQSLRDHAYPQRRETDMKRLIATLILVLPMAANAASVRYEVSGTGVDEDQWSLEGGFLIDEADLIPGLNLVDDFLSWEFTATDGVTSFSLSSADGDVLSSSAFVVDNQFSVDSVLLCPNACTQLGVFLDSWSLIIRNVATLQGSASWSGPVTVPEPSTLALFGIGLAGIGLARRRRKS
jgi:hypothetical protein